MALEYWVPKTPAGKDLMMTYMTVNDWKWSIFFLPLWLMDFLKSDLFLTINCKAIWLRQRSTHVQVAQTIAQRLLWPFIIQLSAALEQPNQKKRKLGELTTKSALADVRAEDVDERGEKEEWTRMESKTLQRAGQDSREHGWRGGGCRRTPGGTAVSMWGHWRLLRCCSLNKVRMIRARSVCFKPTHSKIYTAEFLLVLKTNDRRKSTLPEVSTMLPLLLNWASSTLKTLKSL